MVLGGLGYTAARYSVTRDETTTLIKTYLNCHILKKKINNDYTAERLTHRETKLSGTTHRTPTLNLNAEQVTPHSSFGDSFTNAPAHPRVTEQVILTFTPKQSITNTSTSVQNVVMVNLAAVYFTTEGESGLQSSAALSLLTAAQ